MRTILATLLQVLGYRNEVIARRGKSDVSLMEENLSVCLSVCTYLVCVDAVGAVSQASTRVDSLGLGWHGERLARHSVPKAQRLLDDQCNARCQSQTRSSGRRLSQWRGFLRNTGDRYSGPTTRRFQKMVALLFVCGGTRSFVQRPGLQRNTLPQ